MAELRPSRKIILRELPPDIVLFHILPRLPPKSVLRFRCVCKQWQSFLKTPTFTKMHCRHVTAIGHHKLLVISTTTPCTFCTIDCEALENGLTATRSLPFEAKPENMSIVASLDGLVCVGIKKTRYDAEYSDLILWNPLTTEYKTLSRTNTDKECYMFTGTAFGLYYNSSDNDYKLVCVTNYHDVYIYSLKSDSWRKVESTQDDFLTIPYRFSESWPSSVLLNEKLYFLKQVHKRMLGPPSYSIMRFDLKTEKFSEIAAPTFGNPMTWWLNFMVVRGCIHLYVTHDITYANSRPCCPEIEMWRMDGEGEWRKVVTYCLMPFLSWFPQSLHVMKNGNWLIHYKEKEKNYVYKVDLKKHPKRQCTDIIYIGMDILSEGKYTETFVSPKQYINHKLPYQLVFAKRNFSSATLSVTSRLISQQLPYQSTATLSVITDLSSKISAASIPKNMNCDKVSKVGSSHATREPLGRFLDSLASSSSSGTKKDNPHRDDEPKNSLARFSDKRLNVRSDGTKAVTSNLACKRVLCPPAATKLSISNQNAVKTSAVKPISTTKIWNDYCGRLLSSLGGSKSKPSYLMEGREKSVEGPSKIRHDCKNDLRALMNRSLGGSNLKPSNLGEGREKTVEGSSKIQHDCKNDLRAALMNSSTAASLKIGPPCSNNNNKERQSNVAGPSGRSQQSNPAQLSKVQPVTATKKQIQVIASPKDPQIQTKKVQKLEVSKDSPATSKKKEIHQTEGSKAPSTQKSGIPKPDDKKDSSIAIQKMETLKKTEGSKIPVKKIGTAKTPTMLSGHDKKNHASTSQSRPYSYTPVYYIKWNGHEKESERSGNDCILCDKDLSYLPQHDYGSYEEDEYEYRIELRPQLLPSVDVLPCGHAFHSECLRYAIPEEQSTDPEWTRYVIHSI
ncbi:hypothetical protein OSB04_012584 [Centaurea solstitialis]|uniref:F-box domain-containing protein n=1 Tax=Centaurea solstitialis TaxID=347529 RepID=A0AA38TBM1_9ASTR|nr:hypothetical protein OSB04_012584 [Centaurea solstitialis]